MTYASAGGRKRAKDAVGHWALTGGLAAEFLWVLIQVGSHARDFAAHDLAYDLGYMLAGTGTVVLVVWAVVYFAFVRRSAPDRALPYLLILFFFAAVVQGGFVALAKSKAEQNAQLRTAATEIESVITSLKASNGSAPVDTRPKATGEAGEFERLIKTYVANIDSDHAAYLAELRDAGVLDALNPQHLAKDQSLTATRASLAAGKAIAKKYRERYHARKAEMRQAIATSTLTPADQRAMLESIDRAEAHGDHADEVWDIEDAYIAEMDATAADLQHARGRWRARGDMVVFSNPADLQAYNQHMAKLRELAGREKALRDAGLRQARDGAEQMRRAAE